MTFGGSLIGNMGITDDPGSPGSPPISDGWVMTRKYGGPGRVNVTCPMPPVYERSTWPTEPSYKRSSEVIAAGQAPSGLNLPTSPFK